MLLSRNTLRTLLTMVDTKLDELTSPRTVISLQDQHERKVLEACRSELLGMGRDPEPEDVA